MGHYTLVIEGSGPFHNYKNEDADVLFRRFYDELTRQGHHISHASFTSSAREEII